MPDKPEQGVRYWEKELLEIQRNWLRQCSNGMSYTGKPIVVLIEETIRTEKLALLLRCRVQLLLLVGKGRSKDYNIAVNDCVMFFHDLEATLKEEIKEK